MSDPFLSKSTTSISEEKSRKSSSEIEWEVFENGLDESLLGYWERISQRITNMSFVQNRAWYESFLESEYENPDHFCFVVMLQNEEPKGIFPLEFTRIKQFGIELKAWRIFWPHDLGINDFIIGDSRGSDCILDKLTDILNERLNISWDVLLLQNCPSPGAIDSAIQDCKPRRTISIYHHDSKYILCRNEEENTLEKLSSKFKKNIRRLNNKLKKTGNITLDFVREKDGLKTAFEEFLKVESAGWKGEGQTALTQNLTQKSFYEAILNSFSKQGRCVIHTLKLDGEPIASQFAILSGETYYMLKIGYDESYKSSGPGTVLLEETIRLFTQDSDINYISFITGSTWQDQWSPEANKVYHHYIFNKSLKALVVYALEVTKNKLRAVKNKIKKG